MKTFFLLILAHREPVLHQLNALSHKQALKVRAADQEGLQLFRRAKAQNALDACSVVPRTVEQNDLPMAWKVRHITLKIPLAAFTFAWFWKGCNTADSGVKCLGDALDRPAFSCGIPPLENNDKARPCCHDPFLQLNQLNLKS